MSASVQIRSAAMAASAGTGKTFALSSRYLALLAYGAEPAAIVALTFTRKAAGEILSRILTRLAQAAKDDKGFAQLNLQLAEGGLPGFSSHAAAQAALRTLVQALPRLRIGTLDSFFLQILRQFRLEYGMASDPAIAQEALTAQEDLVLQRLLAQQAPTGSERGEWMEAFARATFGEEKKSVYGALQDLIGDQYELYRRAPEPGVWGDAARIWPGGLPEPAEPDWPAVLAALENQAQAIPPGQAREDWNRFVAVLKAFRETGGFDFKNTLAERLYRAHAPPLSACDSVKIRQKEVPLSIETQKQLASAFAHIRFSILGRQVARTRGLYHLLAAYGRSRHDHLVRSGQVAFNDIAHLLDPASGLAPNRLRTLMDFRLDARFEHWLLDEFQDTSLVQWAVIENLVDEVLQDAEGDRTLFYVGDIKQAIYEWRGGDPRLFRRILAKYNRAGPVAIEEPDPLIHSWRSSPVVLQGVNQVFGSLQTIPLPAHEHLQEDWPVVAARWAEEWQAHRAAEPNQDMSGHVALHVLPPPAKAEKEENEDAFSPAIRRAADLVVQLQGDMPEFERYSVAILTRSNSDGLKMLAALAGKGVRAAWAGNSELLDNTLIPAILSFAKLIEHPGDEFARQHVLMSALVPAVSLAPAELAAWGQLIREQGYAGFATRLAALLDLDLAPLEASRLRLLIAIAAEFDRAPDGDALRFCSHVRAQEIPAEQSGSNIHILTMHKAKGLEYDIVILPALGSGGITSHSKEALLVHETPVDEPNPPVEWILSSPETKALEAEPVLAAQYAEDRCSNALEELRLLYVAMTRAKRALHLITEAPTANSKTLRLANILQKTLALDAAPHPDAPVWEIGPRDWWRQKTGAAKPAGVPCAPLRFGDLPQAPFAKPLDSRIASQEHATGETRAGWPFRPEGTEARDFGTRAHALFEQIEWLAPGEWPPLEQAGPPEAHLAVEFLKNPRNHAFFERPAGEVELLREQAFEAILGGRWLSGKIDRLHLEKDAAGRAIRARILDFKTDRVADYERHRLQMEDYRQAVALLFSLPPTQISCTLLFVRTGDVHEL